MEADVGKGDELPSDQAKEQDDQGSEFLAPLVVRSDFDRSVKVQVKYWQQLLRLTDWKLDVTYWPHHAMESAVAKLKWNRNAQSATIVLRIPEDLDPVIRDWAPGEAEDYDQSILHELLHLKCLPMEGEVDWAEEQLCNHLAAALVQLYRRDPQAGPPTPPLSVQAPATSGGGHYL
jgi:hypothetical protein